MHESAEASLAAFKALEKKFGRARATFGGFVAYAELSLEHGRSTDADEVGHFDIHEYEKQELHVQFSLHSIIPSSR
jgi:hypothetical protein